MADHHGKVTAFFITLWRAAFGLGMVRTVRGSPQKINRPATAYPRRVNAPHILAPMFRCGMVGRVNGNGLRIMVYSRVRMPAKGFKDALRSAAATGKKVNDYAHISPSDRFNVMAQKHFRTAKNGHGDIPAPVNATVRRRCNKSALALQRYGPQAFTEVDPDALVRSIDWRRFFFKQFLA